MQSLFNQLKPYWKWVLVIILAHISQGFFTLLLPQYTSQLVDTGIQNQGFEYGVPLALRQEDWVYLDPYIEGGPTQHYDQEAGHLYLKADLRESEAALADLEASYGIPLALYQTLVSQEPDQVQAVRQALEAGQGYPQAFVDQAQALFDAYGEDYVHTTAVQGSLALYEAAGLSARPIQQAYFRQFVLEMVGVSVGIIGSAFLAFYCAARVGGLLGQSLRRQIFSQVLTFSEAEMDAFSTASLITRSSNDIQQIQLVVTVFLRAMLFAPILAAGGLLAIIIFQPQLAWVILVSLLAIGLLVLVLVKLTMPRFRQIQPLFDRVNLITREILTGLQVIRAFGRQAYEQDRFEEANSRLQKNFLVIARVMSVMMPVMIFILNGASILIVWVGGQLIGQGQMQVGDMMAFITYSMQVLGSFLNLTVMSLMFPRALVALRRVEEVIQQEASVQDPERPQEVQAETMAGQVAFNQVAFRYQGASQDSVSGIDFIANPGETTAIIGSTGSGKSTILSLLMRFHDVSSGSIAIDGIDIRDMRLDQLYDLIGYVPQKAVLFSGTIRDNIGYGLETMSEAVMERAGQLSHAEDFILARDQAYDARIAQGGSNVSGGQKQRLSIARAIAKDPLIYLFDDSFSALDYRTDASLRQALKENMTEATVIIVAQRVSTILHAEKIVVLDEGRIDGIGTHGELMKKSQVYREIAESQLSPEELSQSQADETLFLGEVAYGQE